MARKDGRFFNLWKQVIESGLEEGTIDPHGIPTLQARDCLRPTRTRLTISAAKAWDPLTINRPMYVWTPDSRIIRFYPGDHRGDLSADAANPWYSSRFALLGTPGLWHISTPIIPGDAEGNPAIGLLGDATLGGFGDPLLPGDIAHEVSAITMEAPGSFTVNHADSIVIPARPGRRYLVINNDSLKDFRIAWGQPAIGGVPGPSAGEIIRAKSTMARFAAPNEILPPVAIHAIADDGVTDGLNGSFQEG